MTLFVGDCRRCGAQRMSFEVYGVSTINEADEIRDAGYSYYERTIELACRCHECRKTIVFVLDALNRDQRRLPKQSFDTNESPTKLGYTEIFAFPPKKTLPTPAHTPNPAASFYEQGASAMANGLYDAAGAMFRKCLESVTRSDKLLEEFVPENQRAEFRKKWLKARIKVLKELHAIPPALASLVDVIKDEGDEAVHEDELYDKESAEALQRFTATFLEQTFTIPEQIAQVRACRLRVLTASPPETGRAAAPEIRTGCRAPRSDRSSSNAARQQRCRAARKSRPV
jgi:hypothetical protein